MACHLIDPDARQDALAAAHRLKMARSAHAYVRGNTAQFYDWLRHLKRGHIPEGPPVWICGDCHVGNLGPLAHSDGRVEIQIRDLDQTVIGNPTHDLIRLGLSLASAARGSDLPGVTTAHILEQMIEGYAGAMVLGRTSGDVDELPEEMRGSCQNRQTPVVAAPRERADQEYQTNHTFGLKFLALGCRRANRNHASVRKRTCSPTRCHAALSQRRCADRHA
jgi:uncharacterized protein (DUF2252 family)